MAQVLVVDDSRLVLRFVQHALDPDGHVVRGLDSFIHLAATVRENPPDVILLDLNIPALSGLSMGRLIRSYQTHDVPIVIYSSASCTELQAAAQEVGARACVQKSEDPSELREVIARICPARRASKA